MPTRYAVQIYGIYQDVDEDNNALGLTFGPATGENYNNAYVGSEESGVTLTEKEQTSGSYVLLLAPVLVRYA